MSECAVAERERERGEGLLKRSPPRAEVRLLMLAFQSPPELVERRVETLSGARSHPHGPQNGREFASGGR